MKIEVTKWAFDTITSFFKQSIEVLLRCLLFILPIGVYLILLQFRNKVSSISNISVYTTDKSVWQHVFPGFILVAVSPDLFKSELKNININYPGTAEQFMKYVYVSNAFIETSGIVHCSDYNMDLETGELLGV